MDVAATSRAVRELYVASDLFRSRAARQWDRSPVELSALILVYVREGTTPHAIASRLNLTTGSVTALLDRLQTAKLIERRANPEDRRSLLIVPTTQGRRMAESFMSMLDEVVAASFSDLDDSVRAQVEEAIARLVENLNGMQPSALDS